MLKKGLFGIIGTKILFFLKPELKIVVRNIVICAIFIALTIYIIWYVIKALEGFDPNYKPYKQPWQSGAHVGNESFDPNKTPTVDSQK